MDTQKSNPVHVGALALAVADLELTADFYRSILGLNPLGQGSGEVTLGAGDTPLVRLIAQPGGRRYPAAPGLYHFAILLPDRPSLARILYQLAERGYPLQGASDHGVSEALYLADPEGNGIELYRDRPAAEWPRDGQGNLEMVTDALNLDRLILELKGKIEPWKGIAAQTVMGHVHLQVSDVAAARAFYTTVIGLEHQQDYGSQASFLSAGGYHHHVGINSWHSRGSAPRPADGLGLRYFELVLPEAGMLAGLRQRAEQAGLSVEPHNGGLLVRDPSQNGVLVRAE